MDRGTAMLAVVLDVYEGGKDLIPGWKLKEHAESALATGGVEGLRGIGRGAVLCPRVGPEPLDAPPVWEDPPAHQATHVASDLIEWAAHGGSELRGAGQSRRECL